MESKTQSMANSHYGYRITIVFGYSLHLEFQKPIMAAYGWNNVRVMWIFNIICFLGLSAAVGGMILPKYESQKTGYHRSVAIRYRLLISAYAMAVQPAPFLHRVWRDWRYWPWTWLCYPGCNSIKMVSR